ncbi:hypothetical protein V1515DRAFT_591232 [Lipomyces mesembrius]
MGKQDGRNRAGYDVMVEEEMGLMHITGEADGAPVKVGVAATGIANRSLIAFTYFIIIFQISRQDFMLLTR